MSPDPRSFSETNRQTAPVMANINRSWEQIGRSKLFLHDIAIKLNLLLLKILFYAAFAVSNTRIFSKKESIYPYNSDSRFSNSSTALLLTL